MSAIEKKVTRLRGAARSAAARAVRAARKAERQACKGSNHRRSLARRSRGVNAFSRYDVTGTIAALRGEPEQLFTARVDATEMLLKEARIGLQAYAQKQDWANLAKQGAEVVKLEAAYAFAVAQRDTKIPTDEVIPAINLEGPFVFSALMCIQLQKCGFCKEQGLSVCNRKGQGVRNLDPA
jgi:hypothetical protein